MYTRFRESHFRSCLLKPIEIITLSNDDEESCTSQKIGVPRKNISTDDTKEALGNTAFLIPTSKFAKKNEKKFRLANKSQLKSGKKIIGGENRNSTVRKEGIKIPENSMEENALKLKQDEFSDACSEDVFSNKTESKNLISIIEKEVIDNCEGENETSLVENCNTESETCAKKDFTEEKSVIHTYSETKSRTAENMKCNLIGNETFRQEMCASRKMNYNPEDGDYIENDMSLKGNCFEGDNILMHISNSEVGTKRVQKEDAENEEKCFLNCKIDASHKRGSEEISENENSNLSDSKRLKNDSQAKEKMDCCIKYCNGSLKGMTTRTFQQDRNYCECNVNFGKNVSEQMVSHLQHVENYDVNNDEKVFHVDKNSCIAENVEKIFNNQEKKTKGSEMMENEEVSRLKNIELSTNLFKEFIRNQNPEGVCSHDDKSRKNVDEICSLVCDDTFKIYNDKNSELCQNIFNGDVNSVDEPKIDSCVQNEKLGIENNIDGKDQFSRIRAICTKYASSQGESINTLNNILTNSASESSTHDQKEKRSVLKDFKSNKETGTKTKQKFKKVSKKKKVPKKKASGNENKGSVNTQKSKEVDDGTRNLSYALKDKNQTCFLEIDKSESSDIFNVLAPFVGKSKIIDGDGQFIMSGYDLATEINKKRYLIFKEEWLQISNKSFQEWKKDVETKSKKHNDLENSKKRRESLKVAVDLAETCIEILQNILGGIPDENHIENLFCKYLYGRVNAAALLYVPQFVHIIMLCRGCSAFSMNVRWIADQCFQKCHSMFPVPLGSNFESVYSSEVLKNTPCSFNRADDIPFNYGDFDASHVFE